MLDQTQIRPTGENTIETFDLVVIGAGIAGLNALNAATDYLPKGAQVLLIDQKPAAGGMWNIAYDYVRLHQPHPMFTVGDMAWNWQKPRDYLPTRNEVQAHLASALRPIGEKIGLKTRFGHTVERFSEIETDSGFLAEVVCHPNGNAAAKTTLRAKRAIHALGLNYRLAEPLVLSSKTIRSIIPQDLLATLRNHLDAPVVVVGGGKTGMDTILATLEVDPQREVTLVKGRGMNFLNRTKYLPTGLKRWTSGDLVSRLFRDVLRNFDGDNEEHTLEHFRRVHSSDPTSNNSAFLYGLQSEEELAKIKSGLAGVHADYLIDIADNPTGPQMHMRSGTTIPISAGAVVVNCTGSIFRSEALSDPTPILSANDCILSINARDGLHFLTSVSGFFATHLLYRGKLRGRGFYTLDLEALIYKNRNAWVGASAAQAYMNQVIAVQTLPLMLLDRCGLDLDRWYPFPRRMAGLIRMKLNAKSDISHCRRVLDRVAERFDVHAAPVK